MIILSKAIYRFHVIPIKDPLAFFAEIDIMFLKFIRILMGPQIAKKS